MNKLSTSERVSVIAALVEGNSINSTVRMTNGFSKKVENHEHITTIFFAYYDYCRMHQTLRITPAMEAGLTDRAWEIEDLIALLDQ
jgi:hypothetical protein